MKFFKFLVVSSKRLRRLLVVAVVTGSISGLTGIGLIALIHRALDPEAPSIEHIGWLFAACCVVATAARVSSVHLLTVLGQELVYDLRLRLCRQVLTTPLRQLETLGANRVLAVLTDDINSLLMAMMMVPGLAVNSTICLGAFAYMALLSWKLFAIFMLFVVIGVASYQVPMLFGLRRYRDAREQQDSLFEHFRSLTSGLKELKLHRERRGAFDSLLDGTSRRLRDLYVQASLIYSTATAWGQMLFFVVIGLLLFARPASTDTDAATLVGFTLLMLYLVAPLQILLNSVPALQRAEVALNKLRALDFELAEQGKNEKGEIPEEKPVALIPAAEFEKLDLVDVRHAYHREGKEGSFELGPLSVTLEPGELIFLVGGNGSGKTTLAKVICGLYEPEDGEIRIDGIPVGGSQADDYRQLFSVVFDDFHLFEELLGLGGDLDEGAKRYLTELQLDHKVTVEDGRLSTVELSKGQRKRLALLTAYLEDRSIYLFDEWAADQDPVFKEIFYREILQRLRERGKLVIAITHDDRYFHLADRVLKLENGHLVKHEHGVSVPSAGASLPN